MPEFNATLVFVMISFIIFMVLMKIIYFDPMLKIQREREQKLTDDRLNAQQFLAEYERIHADYQSSLKEARKEAHMVIQEIRQQAKLTAQHSLQVARSQAQSEMEQQMADLNAWRETTYQSMQSEREALIKIIVSKVTAGRKVEATSSL